MTTKGTNSLTTRPDHGRLYQSCTCLLLLHFGTVCAGSALAHNPLLLSCSFNPEGGARYVSPAPLPFFIPLPDWPAESMFIPCSQWEHSRDVWQGKALGLLSCDDAATDGCICPCGRMCGLKGIISVSFPIGLDGGLVAPPSSPTNTHIAWCNSGLLWQ